MATTTTTRDSDEYGSDVLVPLFIETWGRTLKQRCIENAHILSGHLVKCMLLKGVAQSDIISVVFNIRRLKNEK
jgi:hypothetical protein